MKAQIHTQVRRKGKHPIICGRCKREVRAGETYHYIAFKTGKVYRCDACPHTLTNDFRRLNSDGFLHERIQSDAEAYGHGRSLCGKLYGLADVTDDTARVTCPDCRGLWALRRADDDEYERETMQADDERRFQRDYAKQFDL